MPYIRILNIKINHDQKIPQPRRSPLENAAILRLSGALSE
jgi:hypothetical protein